MGGGHPISWQEMRAWRQMTGRQILPWEARLIRRLGDRWLTVDAEKRAARRGKGEAAKPGVAEAAMRPVKELRGFLAAKFGKKG